ncbi:MAG: OmpH family outer membrane protein [Spirochaetaceae bacterium]|jgi:outer membrane protein|nr:OmpH family outer membrane protein [Spirochaetaceae bacterium]
MMMRKKTAVLVVFFIGLGILEAQQLTRFAVVDMTKVYTAFFRESRAVREFEERSRQVQVEIDRMTEEIQELRLSHAAAAARGDRDQALRLENEVNRRSEYLKEYYQLKTTDLENQKKRLAQSSTFLDQILTEIRYIAESEGYTMVLNLKDNTGIIWYSPTVDITDKLIQSLSAKAGR